MNREKSIPAVETILAYLLQVCSRALGKELRVLRATSELDSILDLGKMLEAELDWATLRLLEDKGKLVERFEQNAGEGESFLDWLAREGGTLGTIRGSQK